MGGMLAKYARQGVEITLVCATKGEAGTVDSEFLEGFDSIAELRESELACAAEVLGLSELIYLGYRDSGMAASPENEHQLAFARADEAEVAEKVAAIMREKQPDIVITFDSTGGYHHPDHIAIHNATVRAFDALEDVERPKALYFTARSRKSLRRLVRLMRLTGKNPKEMGRNKDIDLTRLVADGDTPPHVSVDYSSVLQQKERADRCHASQLGENGLSGNALLRFFRRLGGNKDRFTRHYPPTEDNFRSNDLFAI